MLPLLATLFGLGCILIVSEYFWRKKILRGEYGRKFVHVASGCFMAFWPYYLPKATIALLALAALGTIVIAKYTRLFSAIHDIKRITMGEYFYPLGLLFALQFARADWIFTTAVLFVAIADGMAAVVGKKYGKKKDSYSVFNMHKTYIGSAAYYVFAYISLLVGMLLAGTSLDGHGWLLVFAALPPLTMMLEAVSPYGIDNILVPVVVVLSLNLLV